jgi:hypothetical protein
MLAPVTVMFVPVVQWLSLLITRSEIAHDLRNIALRDKVLQQRLASTVVFGAGYTIAMAATIFILRPNTDLQSAIVGTPIDGNVGSLSHFSAPLS